MKKLGDLNKGNFVIFIGDLYEVIGVEETYVLLKYIRPYINIKKGWKNNSLVKYLNSLTSEDTIKACLNNKEEK